MSHNEEEPASNFKQATLSTIGDYSYSFPSERSNCQDMTPYSAVSSFNLPAHYDSTLITPVSLTGSPTMTVKTVPVSHGDRDIKLSPSTLSPFQFFPDEDDFGVRYNLPMKPKDTSANHPYQDVDSPFDSPFSPPPPYFGSYGVSAPPRSGISSRTMESTPSLIPSPKTVSAGGYSLSSYGSHRQTTPLSARSAPSYLRSDPPILIAPDPSTLRHTTKREKAPSQHDSFDPNLSILRSDRAPEAKDSPSPPRGKKRKSPAISSADEDDDVYLPQDLTFEERLLLELYVSRQYEWKQLTKTFNARSGQDLKQEALQMRKKRLLDRLMENAMTGFWLDWNESKWDALAPRCGKSDKDGVKWTAAKQKWLAMNARASEATELSHNKHSPRKSSSASSQGGNVGEFLHTHGLPMSSNVLADIGHSRTSSNASAVARQQTQQDHSQDNKQQHVFQQRINEGQHQQYRQLQQLTIFDQRKVNQQHEQHPW